jgi:small-conductance mechanosensitive channel
VASGGSTLALLALSAAAGVSLLHADKDIAARDAARIIFFMDRPFFYGSCLKVYF